MPPDEKVPGMLHCKHGVLESLSLSYEPATHSSQSVACTEE